MAERLLALHGHKYLRLKVQRPDDGEFPSCCTGGPCCPYKPKAQMNPERWLCSKLKLCQLTTGVNSGLTNEQEPAEVVINTQSYPEPHYDASSIFLTLEAYCGALAELCGRGDQKLQGPNPVESDVLQHFAEMLSGDILGAAVRQTASVPSKHVPHRDQVHHTSDPNERLSNQEKLAKELAFEIYRSAMEEVANRAGFENKQVNQEVNRECSGYSVSSLCSSMYPYEEGEGHGMETDTKVKECNSTQESRVQCSGSTTNTNTMDIMAQMGSLDYPDAPPSTPLVPELMKSRASFTRKLKSELAKEFLPSPPPPTPKDQQAAADKSEFLVRLMRSLSLACLQHGNLNEGQNGEDTGGIGISNHEAQLSADTHCVTAAQTIGSTNREATDLRGVQCLADHLAEEVIMSSIAEVMRSRKVDGIKHADKDTASYIESRRENATHKTPSVEALRSLAARLIADTLIQSFSDLSSGALQNALRKTSTGPAESTPWQREDQYSNSSLNYYQPASTGCWNEKSNVVLDRTVTSSTAEQSFAENFVHKVLECSIREASQSLRCNQTNIGSDKTSSSVVSQQTSLRGVVPDTLCHDIEELECALLWMAASCMEIPVLKIDLPDKYIQPQLHGISVQAQIHGWTVGDLMASLLQHCEDLQAASRGHSRISTSLLGHLMQHMTMG